MVFPLKLFCFTKNSAIFLCFCHSLGSQGLRNSVVIRISQKYVNICVAIIFVLWNIPDNNDVTNLQVSCNFCSSQKFLELVLFSNILSDLDSGNFQSIRHQLIF
ncbi:Protein of unknown function [Gryllus bimaculatus]|nr:Protein of unknown function [Gryllus bimaculatus]